MAHTHLATVTAAFLFFCLPRAACLAQNAATVEPSALAPDPQSETSDTIANAVGADTTGQPPEIIPLGTTVMIRLDAPVTSRTAVQGDMFPISLAEPVLFNGVEVIPAGISGEGQVVHAQGRGFGGRAGELIVAARYLMWGERRIVLRGMRISAAGRTNTAEALAVGLAVPLAGLFITGTSVDLPSGQVALARLAADVPIGVVAPAPTDQSATVTQNHVQQGETE
ncbi:MAG: hypothetical protein ABL874_08140 [Sphingopyxis sp.]